MESSLIGNVTINLPGDITVVKQGKGTKQKVFNQPKQCRQVLKVTSETWNSWITSTPSRYEMNKLSLQLPKDLSKVYSKKYPGKEVNKKVLTQYYYFTLSEFARAILHVNDIVSDMIGRAAQPITDYKINLI